ncbi:hypothetical protein PIB30_071724 [Stylosanthes scabra]|uniref:Uncharacterized protein n=1 Tax=Stylosanthes scabra TaxID=79078 RepID=A0ABU6TQE8_9FABA|nr:hypothetical protein [Stylosanthes scabra]
MEDNAEKYSLGPNHDTSSSSLSAPPGFEHDRETSSGNMKNIPERVRGRSRERKRGRKKQSRKMSLKLIDQVKERARRKKEEHKKNIGKQKQARVTEIEDDAWESEEEIEATESDEEDTWWVGTRTGLRAKSEEGAKKYLKSKEEEAKEIAKDLRRKGPLHPKGTPKKIGECGEILTFNGRLSLR